MFEPHHASGASKNANIGLRGLVGDIDRFAVHDGPGIRTAVFLKGCPLQCTWCHSPETQSFSPELLNLTQKCNACGLCLDACPLGAISAVEAPPESVDGSPACRVAIDWDQCNHCAACTTVCYTGALKMSGTWMEVAELVDQVERDRPFFLASGGGVTLSGGEATSQPVFSRQFLTACHDLGIHTALETNGCASWEVYQSLLGVVDLFLYDIKHMDERSHRRLTGASNHLALRNLSRLSQQPVEIIVRVPCIPGMNDDAENIAATAAFVRQVGLTTIHLLPYNAAAGAKYQWLGRKYNLEEQHTQSSEKMNQLADVCRAQGLFAVVEG